MRAFFAKGVYKMHVPWAVEGLPALLHLSLFLFFGGLAIFLFNVDQEVFICVVLWIGLFLVVYVLLTMLPLIRHDSPYYTPLSIPIWFPYAVIHYANFAFRSPRFDSECDLEEAYERYYELRGRYRGWILGGMEKTAAETASERPSGVDIGILGWTISALGDDDSLEKFFEAIPGFFNSKLVEDLREHLPDNISTMLSNALGGFLGRTLSSNSVIGSVKSHRLDICLSAINSLPNTTGASSILFPILLHHWNQVPRTVELGHIISRWCFSHDEDIAWYAQIMVSSVLVTVRERDDRWVELAVLAYDLTEREVRDIVTHGDDSVSLAVLIHFTRTPAETPAAFRSFPLAISLAGVLKPFTRFDIRYTLSGLQHDFCTLWNEIVQEAKNQGYHSNSVEILKTIRHHYIVLHQGTDAAPTAFSSSTHYLQRILFEPSSYPLCNIASHRREYVPVPVPVPVPTQPAHFPDPSPRLSISGRSALGSTVSLQVNEATIITGPPSLSHPTTLIGIRDSSQPTVASPPALPVHTNPRPIAIDASPPGAVAAALQDIPPRDTSSHPLGGTTPRDIVAPCTEPDIIEMLSIASLPTPTPALFPVPASTPPVLDQSLELYDAGAASTSDPLLPASSIVDFSITTSPSPSRDSSLPNAEFHVLNSTTSSHSTGHTTLPHLRARGLVNTGSMCFANAVLQLLANALPFCNLFREFGGLKGRCGVGGREIDGGATPLVDATVRFFEEFVVKENVLPPMQQPPQQAAGGKPREDEEATKEYTAMNPMYLYDAMKEKRRLETFLVRSRST